MVLPLRVDNLQHDVAFDATQQVGTDHLLFLVVARLDLRPEHVAEFLRVFVVQLQRFELLRLQAEHTRYLAHQSRHVPLVEVDRLAGEALDQVLQDVFGQRQQVRARVDNLLV